MSAGPDATEEYRTNVRSDDRDGENETPRSVDQRVRYSFVREFLPAPPSCVFEVGVGGGWLLTNLSKAGYDVRGCDVSLDWLAEDSPIRDRVITASGASLPYEDDEFDSTYSCDVLEHVRPENRESFLTEMFRITKPGGTVIVTAFYHNTIGFRLWGAATLATSKTLPDWYLEHFQMPLPLESDTLALFARLGEGVTSRTYQRALNLLLLWFQFRLARRPRLARLVDPFASIVARQDKFGSPTSMVVCAKKPYAK